MSTVTLIVTNVMHNIAVTAHHGPDREFLARAASSPFLIAQIAFMAFVLATARLAWNGTASSRPAEPVQRP